MAKEKRKYFRFDCPVPVHLIQIEGGKRVVKKATLDEISREGLKLTFSFDLDLRPGSEVDFKLNIPEKRLTSKVLGEIVWSKPKGKKLEMGLKIKDMDKILKSELMDLVYAKWREAKAKEIRKKTP
ncbi:MAG: PilZ domain-containing protein [Candidatus Aminicenantes bacterium]|nr:PilZ domain-containing protein [Candidatus Aminicenantes bacterium]